jgi:hypothetical protein
MKGDVASGSTLEDRATLDAPYDNNENPPFPPPSGTFRMRERERERERERRAAFNFIRAT